ncbi:MAG TPA: AMP-binding protein, partial [Telmatospirillum sp.]|nr:AMP-binding protein [Telmatospirillum sp.]
MTSPEAWLRRQAAVSPQDTALVTEDRSYRFACLDQQIDRLAQALRDLLPGQVLGCVSTRTESLALLALAAPRAGLAFLPINPKLTVSQIEALCAKAGVSVVLGDDPARQATAQRRLAWDQISNFAGAAPARRGDSNAVHLIIATSGSTGTPKGVMLTGANLAAAVRASRQRLPIDPGDVWLGCLPTYHIGGLQVLFRCLEAGATTLLHPRFDVEAVAADLAAGRATHVSLVPAMLAQLLDAGCRPSPKLRCALIGGAGLPAALAARATAAGWPISPSYGMSEAGSQVATCARLDDWRPGMAGEPLPGLEVGTTSDGRIRVRGPAVMAGYVNPTLSLGDGLDGEGWFETSDLGGLNETGRLQVLG